MVTSDCGSPPTESGNRTVRASEAIPLRTGKRPVSSPARLAVQYGAPE
jgi:hypothetical protein